MEPQKDRTQHAGTNDYAEPMDKWHRNQPGCTQARNHEDYNDEQHKKEMEKIAWRDEGDGYDEQQQG
jgi:hypothetical protein